MEIVHHHPALLPGDHLGISVVIDVLRATSTATVLASRGARHMLAVETPADLPPIMHGREREFLVVSEMREVEEGPNRIDNSPVVAKDVDLAGRVPILVTTNGTRALGAAMRCSDRVLLASFLNLASVVKLIRRLGPKKVSLLPAGKFSEATGRIEDDLCAEMLHGLLEDADPAEARIFASIRADENIQRRLRRPGFSGDLDLALTPNLYDVVPYVDRQVRGGAALEIRVAAD